MTVQRGFSKIVVDKPIVELDGDEMTRIIWKKIREEVCFPTIFPIYSSTSHSYQIDEEGCVWRSGELYALYVHYRPAVIADPVLSDLIPLRSVFSPH